MNKIKKWYQGKPYVNKPEDRIIVLGYYERHWTAQIARKVIKYLKKEYKFVISLALSIIGLAVALVTLL